jgi:hypothetical protein
MVTVTVQTFLTSYCAADAAKSSHPRMAALRSKRWAASRGTINIKKKGADVM